MINAETSLKEFLLKLNKNYLILREREAKYASAAPLDLLNQIDDYEHAIELTEQAIEQDIPLDDLQTEFSGFNLQIDTVVFVAQVPPRKPFTGQNPYRGLRKFTEDEAEFFFGRDAAIQSLLDTIKYLVETETSRQVPDLFAVLGASGSGKSSLVRAGLIPSLREGRLAGSNQWSIKVMLPGPRPLDALAELFIGDIERGLGAIRKELDEGEKALHYLMVETLAGKPKEAIYVLVIDQFEELFALCEDEAERRAFLDQILYACQVRGNRGFVVLTMRADFYAKAAYYKNFAETITRSQMLVSPMTEKELREAILLPAEAVGLELEKDLVQALVHDTFDAPGALPLLQHALQELFERKDGNLLTMKAYEEIGGIKGAIAHRADNIMNDLLPEQQKIARRIFLRLIQPGEGTADIRRRATFKEVLTEADQTGETEGIVQILANANLLITNRNPETDQVVLDVSHEALIQEWPTLQNWLNEDRQGLRIRQRLSQATQDWQERNRSEDSLYRGARLLEAEEWVKANPDEINVLEAAFLDASQAAAEAIERAKAAGRRRRDLLILGAGWMGILVAGVGIVMACLMTGLAVLAIRFAFITQVKAMTDRAEQMLESNPELAVLNALAVQSITDSDEATRIIAEAPIKYPPLIATLTGHDNQIEKVAVNQDGTLLASLSYYHPCFNCDGPENPKIIIWDTKDHSRLTTLTGPKVVRDFAFSPDGRHLATGGTEIMVWDVTSGQSVLTHQVDNLAFSLAFHPDGKRLAYQYGKGGAYIAIWDTNSDHVVDISVRAENLVFSPDGVYLAGTSGDTVIIWDIVQDQAKAKLKHLERVTSLALSPDGSHLASGTVDGRITIWDLASNQQVTSFKQKQSFIGSIAWSPTARYLTADDVVWDLDSNQPVITLKGAWPSSLAYSPDGMRLVSGSFDQMVKIWDMGDIQRPTILDGQQGGVVSVAFDPAGQHLASGLQDNTIIIWNVATGQPERTLEGHTGEVGSVAFSPDGQWLASGSHQDNTIIIWNVATGQLDRTLEAEAGGVHAIAFSPDGTTLASASDNLLIWDLVSGRLERALADGSGAGISVLAFSPDGELIAAASQGSQLKITVWNVNSGQPVTIIDGGGFAADAIVGIRDITFSPDGKNLVWATFGGIQIWDLAKNEKIMAYIGRQNYLSARSSSSQIGVPIGDRFDEEPITTRIEDIPGFQSLAISHDGKVLAGNTGSLILFWSLDSGQLMSTIAPEVGGVSSIAFSPDGTYLAIGGLDGRIRILDTRFIKHPCQWVTRNLSREEWWELWAPFPIFYKEVCPDLPVPSIKLTNLEFLLYLMNRWVITTDSPYIR